LQFPYSANTNQFKHRKRKKRQYQSPALTQGGPLTHDKKPAPASAQLRNMAGAGRHLLGANSAWRQNRNARIHRDI